MTDMYMIVGDAGEPIGVADMDQITTAGTELAFALAAHSNDREALDRITAEAITKAGTGAFGYVAASALSIVVREILSPSFDLAEAMGHDLRAGMLAISEGREP